MEEILPAASPHRRGIALLAVTRDGSRLMQTLRQVMPDADLYVPAKFFHRGGTGSEISQRPIDYQISRPIGVVVAELFQRYAGLVLCMALGAAVRLVAPCLTDKRTDPAVVVVDESGRFAISLLSAHVGGGNRLAAQVADALQALPVITTASELKGRVAVDLVGEPWGWRLEPQGDLAAVSAAVVNGDTVGVIQESGSPRWWPHPRPMSWVPFASLESAVSQASSVAAWMIITHRLLDQKMASCLLPRMVWRPLVLWLGMGCSSGVSLEEVETLIRTALEQARLSWNSVAGLATIAQKRDEAAFRKIAERYRWPLRIYEPDELNAVEIPDPSKTVFRAVGAHGVSQAAALLSAKTHELLIRKVKSAHATLAVALEAESDRGAAF